MLKISGIWGPSRKNFRPKNLDLGFIDSNFALTITTKNIQII
jgi:hypothetical protein